MNNELNITQEYTSTRLDRQKEENEAVFEVEMEPEDDGRWHVWCPILRGCHTWGHTQIEAMQYIEEAVNLYLEALIEDGKPIPGIGKVTKIKPIIRLKEKIEEKKEATEFINMMTVEWQ
jgi:predicted RNase H-like HicB family nuclease